MTMGPWEETIERVAQSFPVGEIMTPKNRLVCAKSRDEAPSVSDNNPDFSVIPVQRNGQITDYFIRDRRSAHDVILANVISDGTSLLSLVDALENCEFAFVLSCNRIDGYVHFSDLNHPLVKLTFYLLLTALEREAVESVEPSLQQNEGFMRNTLGNQRIDYVKKQYGKHGNAARNPFSYMNISDVLRVAFAAGTIQASGDFIEQARQVRNAAAHSQLALVTSYSDVSKLANVKRETLRLLSALETGTAQTMGLRSIASSAGR
jgi:hypothetical protein